VIYLSNVTFVSLRRPTSAYAYRPKLFSVQSAAKQD